MTTTIKTPAQALAALEQAKKILLAVAASPATSCAPTNDPEIVEWTEEQGATYAHLRDALAAIVDEMEA